MTLDLNSVAVLKNNKVYFEIPGTVFGNYGYSFGEHLWSIKLKG